MIQALESSSVVRHTERFFTLRRMERQAGRSLAEAAADVGDQLLQIRAELAREKGTTWTAWLAAQAERARAEGLEPIAERRAREYMALARFRIESGEEFALYLHIDPACLFPILSLTSDERATVLKQGVPATRDEVRAAVRTAKGTAKPAPTRSDRIAELQKEIEALGPLTDAERKALASSIGVTATANETPEAQPTGAAAPVRTFTGLLGPVTMQGGQLTIGSLDRTALADEAIAAIVQVRQKALAVPMGTGTLALGRKKTAADAVEQLRLAVLDWPAWR